MIRRRNIFSTPPDTAFTLVEVVVALGIASFAVLAMVALLPTGIASTKDTLDESAALNVLSEVVVDRKATPLASISQIYKLSALTSGMSAVTNTFGILDNNQYSTALSQARYRVVCSFTPPVSGTLGPYLGYFRISWPASSPTTAGMVEIVITFSQP